MRERRVTLPEIVLIAATRGMLGLGAGLLISERLARDRRKAVGWSLLTVGALSTIPLAVRLFRRRRDNEAVSEQSAHMAQSARSDTLPVFAEITEIEMLVPE
jgi:hypothetical protein